MVGIVLIVSFLNYEIQDVNTTMNMNASYKCSTVFVKTSTSSDFLLFRSPLQGNKKKTFRSCTSTTNRR